MSAAHLFQVGAIGPCGRRFVKEDRHVEAAPDLQACLPGQQHALLQLDAGDRNKGNYVGRADAGMNALLAGQVDQFDGFASAAHGRLDHRSGSAGDGHHGAIVVGIHRPVEQVHSLDAHRGHNGLDPPGIRALGEVGNALDYGPLMVSFTQSPHSTQTSCRGSIYFQKV